MEKMKEARKLKCGHCFHQFCLMQMILNNKKTCPLCRVNIYTGQPMPDNRQPQRPPQRPLAPQQMPPPQNAGGNNRLGNFLPHLFLRNRLPNPLLSDANINRVQEVFPNLSREQIGREILIYGGVEQTILALSERL